MKMPALGTHGSLCVECLFDRQDGNGPSLSSRCLITAPRRTSPRITFLQRGHIETTETADPLSVSMDLSGLDFYF